MGHLLAEVPQCPAAATAEGLQAPPSATIQGNTPENMRDRATVEEQEDIRPSRVPLLCDITASTC